MFNGSRFFNLARKWERENRPANYFLILQDVMDHYFGSIAGYHKPHRLCIKGEYSKVDIAFVLDAVGYFDYTIEGPNIAGNTIVTLRNSLWFL